MEATPLTPTIEGVPLGNLKQQTLFPMAEVSKPTREEVNKKVNAIKAANLERRNQEIKERFNHLYNVDRIRPDDILNKLAEEFCLAKSTIESALKG